MHYAGWRRGAVGPMDGRWRCRLTIDRDRIRAPAVTIPPAAAAAAAGRLMSCTRCQHLHCCCAVRIYTPFGRCGDALSRPQCDLAFNIGYIDALYNLFAIQHAYLGIIHTDHYSAPL